MIVVATSRPARLPSGYCKRVQKVVLVICMESRHVMTSSSFCFDKQCDDPQWGSSSTCEANIKAFCLRTREQAGSRKVNSRLAAHMKLEPEAADAPIIGGGQQGGFSNLMSCC